MGDIVEKNGPETPARTGKEEALLCIRPVEKKKSIAEVVYKTLKDAIVKGDLMPGQRLVEQRLARKLQVGRAPVHEAVKRLEHRGFVERLPTRGTVVRKVGDDDIREAFGVRAALESYAAYLACEHVTEELLAALLGNINASMHALEKGDLMSVTDLEADFDEMIYRAAGSEVLYKLITTFLDHITRRRTPQRNSMDEVGPFLEAHRALAEAMLRGDRERVEKIARRHVLEKRNLILKREAI